MSSVRTGSRPLLVIGLLGGLLGSAACSSSSDEAGATTTSVTIEPPATTVAPRTTSAQVLRISEVGFGPDYLIVDNFSPVATDLGSRHVCVPPDCAALPAVQLEAGRSVRIDLAEGSGGDVAVTLPGLTPQDGEIGLYGGTDTDDPAAVESYLEWGSSPHAGTATAVAAGRWLDESYAPSSPTAARVRLDPASGLWTWEP